MITQAKIPHKYEYEHDRVGFNYRMPNLNAALGLAQLENIESILKSKEMLANAYKNFLKDSNVKFVVEKKIQSRIIGSVQSFLKMLMIEQIFWNWLMKKMYV